MMDKCISIDVSKSYNSVLQFECDDLKDEAARLLSKKSISKSNQINQNRLTKRVQDVFDSIKDTFAPKVVISYYTKDTILLNGNKLIINGVDLKCRVFEQIDPQTVKGVYVWFVNIGDYILNDRPLSDRLIADLWGTSFVDVIRSKVLTMLREKARISEEFGPGFYGMDICAMHQLIQLADASRIGIHLNNSGMLIPEKACGILCFEVSDDYNLVSSACKGCLGTSSNCYLCNHNRR